MIYTLIVDCVGAEIVIVLPDGGVSIQTQRKNEQEQYPEST